MLKKPNKIPHQMFAARLLSPTSVSASLTYHGTTLTYKSTPQRQPSGEGLLLLAVTALELLMNSIFQTLHTHQLIITLLTTIYVFASAVPVTFFPRSGCAQLPARCGILRQAGVLPTLNSNYVFARKSCDLSADPGRIRVQRNFLPV